MDNSQRVVIGSLFVIPSVIGIAAIVARCFRVARPAYYLVRTGMFINDPMGMRVGRKAFALPIIQKLDIVCSLSFSLGCLSKEYLPFKMPVSYRLSPFDPTGFDVEELVDGKEITVTSEILFKRYTQKINSLEPEVFNNTLCSIIHGETRALAAKMSIDEKIIYNIQQLLLPFGLRIDNANIAELTEEKRANGEMGYLAARERKKLSDAVQQSEINVAEATKCGDIGKKQREASTRQEKARLEAFTKQIEFEAQQQIAKCAADLAVVTAESQRRENVSAVEAKSAAEERQQQLQTKIEEYRAEQLYYRQNEPIAAAILRATGIADAIKIEAEAYRFRGEQEAQVIFAKLDAEARSKKQSLEAQAIGTQKFVEACGGNAEMISAILSIEKGIPQAIAKENANAVQGLKPQIWALSGDDAGTQISKLIGGLTPLMDIYTKTIRS